MKKILLTESEKKAIISEREKAIIANFVKTFNSIKRIDENDIEDFEAASRGIEYGINPYQDKPEMGLGELTQDQETMKKYISRYVDSELELNHEISIYINNGYQGLSDKVKQGLRNDMDFNTYVEIKKDRDQYNRERGF